MIGYINGEERFQIVGGSFAITPPMQNYKLMYSVDGQAFYTYAEYLAGTPLVVTNAIPGLWFMLYGNRDKVQILQ